MAAAKESLVREDPLISGERGYVVTRKKEECGSKWTKLSLFMCAPVKRPEKLTRSKESDSHPNDVLKILEQVAD